MNRAMMVEKIASDAGISLKAAKAALNAMLDSIEQSLADGQEVQLVNFGTFKVKYASERLSRNPQTGESILVPACKRPAFTPGKKLKELVNY